MPFSLDLILFAKKASDARVSVIIGVTVILEGPPSLVDYSIPAGWPSELTLLPAYIV